MTTLVDPMIVIALTCLVGLAVVAAALLRGWQGWLELKRQEIERAAGTQVEQRPGVGTARIELADLKERIRKLEAIASGIEL